MLHSHLAPDHLAAGIPTTLWIELTSRCPFDCVFCSRKLRRGAGEHMDFALYRSLMEQLRDPQMLRLNYSGESIHYPDLIQAIVLAKGTGAATELVSAFASAPRELIEGLVGSGLDLLRVSVHSADAATYDSVYRFSSMKFLRERLDEFLKARDAAGTASPKLEFAFVAMSDNLNQLPGVAALARECGVTEIQVLPVVRRDPILFDLNVELDSGNRIRPAFAQRVREAVLATRLVVPEVRLTLTNPEAECGHGLSVEPSFFPGLLPDGACISTCEQNPWETAHVLANGDIVVCEVRDKIVMGNLGRDTLHDIWHGERYRAFRRQYTDGSSPECRACPWKVAYTPAPLSTCLTASREFHPQLLTGWFEAESDKIWSRRESRMALANVKGSAGLRFRGTLPPGSGGEANRLQIECNGRMLDTIENDSEAIVRFDRFIPLDGEASKELQLRFVTRFEFTPAHRMLSADSRSLGFGLSMIEVVNAKTLSEVHIQNPEPGLAEARARQASWRGFRTAQRFVDTVGFAAHKLAAYRRAPHTAAVGSGISVIIPERDNIELLRECLESLALAISGVDEPVETIVVTSGTGPARYQDLANEQHGVRWIHLPAPAPYSEAVRRGMRTASHPWVYLLNNDMTVDPQAITELLPHRSPAVFAVGSQIFFRDSSRRREETNLSQFRFDGGVIELYEIEPSSVARPQRSFYAGGGSSLFQKSLLKRFMGYYDPYLPFYWEDVEWSTLARKSGFEVLFCPKSRVIHIQRATALKYYPAAEIERIFERNRLKYQLRNLVRGGSLESALQQVALMDEVSFHELTSLRSLAGILEGRLRTWLCPLGDESLMSFCKPSTGSSR